MNTTMQDEDDFILETIAETRRALGGMGKTKLYELIHAGRLDARKIDKRTLITKGSRKRLAASLPAFKSGAAS